MIRHVFEALRDLLIGYFPKRLCPKILKNREFAFICHPLDERDAAKKYPFAKGINKRLFNLWIRFFWPVIGAEIIGPPKNSGRLSRGWVIICPLSPEIMLNDMDRARKVIRRALKLCEKLGVQLVSLGGYNSIITHDGEDLLEGSEVAITTGNTYSTLLIMQNLNKISEELRIDLKNTKIALVGAAGSVGNACARMLPSLVQELHIMDINRKSLKVLYADLHHIYTNVFIFDDVSSIRSFDIVITVTSTPKAIIHVEDIQSGMIFIDASQPYNISDDIARQREDILVVNSGIAEVPHLECEMDMGPHNREVYACLGETLALICHNKIENFSIGKVDVEKVGELSRMVNSCNFRTARFRNVTGFITTDRLKQFGEKYVKKMNTTHAL